MAGPGGCAAGGKSMKRLARFMKGLLFVNKKKQKNFESCVGALGRCHIEQIRFFLLLFCSQKSRTSAFDIKPSLFFNDPVDYHHAMLPTRLKPRPC